MNKFIRILFLPLLLSGFLQLNAQEPLLAGRLGTSWAFNFQDVFWNFGGGLESPRIQGSLTAEFGFRPGSKKLLVETGNNQFDQYRERRYLLTLAAEKRFTFVEFALSKLQAFGTLRGSYTFGDYRGAGYGPETGFIFNPAAGVDLAFDDGMIQLGYSYVPLPTASISPHRIYLSFNVFLLP